MLDVTHKLDFHMGGKFGIKSNLMTLNAPIRECNNLQKKVHTDTQTHSRLHNIKCVDGIRSTFAQQIYKP